MNSEENKLITYEGTQIALFSANRNEYVNLTDMAQAWKGRRKAIKSWLKNKQTLDFLRVWENRNNPKFNGAQMGTVFDMAKDSTTSLSVKYYIEQTNAIGIFTRKGSYGGTYAHKDIAIRFASWLSPEFELYLIEEIQRLKDLEEKKYSYDLLTHEQILNLVRLKEVFKYVAHHDIVEDAHMDLFAARSGSKNPFAEFHKWRNNVLKISPKVINERIKSYCEVNDIALVGKYLNKTKREKILILDSYESVRNAVWDFLNIKGEVNALNLANLVGEMLKIEQGEVLRQNEDNLFQVKERLWGFEDFEERIGQMEEIKTARELLEYRKLLEAKPMSGFNRKLKKALEFNPKKEEQ